jgi:hypothetical protein
LPRRFSSSSPFIGSKCTGTGQWTGNDREAQFKLGWKKTTGHSGQKRQLSDSVPDQRFFPGKKDSGNKITVLL